MTVREFEQITVKALKEGSTEAFDVCFTRFYAPLCAFARSRMAVKEIAEEIVQNIFAELWENRNILPAKTDIKSYLFHAVKNDCIDFARHRQVEQKYIDYLIETREESEEFFDNLVDEDFQKLIADVYNSLPEQCRVIFMMSRLENMSYKEIAAKMDISVKTVENQIGKALRLVKERLEKEL